MPFANGVSVPDYGRAFMWARSEHNKPGLIQADVSTVNKPLGSGSSLANNYHSFVSKNCGVLIERDSWFGHKRSRILQSWRNNHYNEWTQSTIPMHREGHVYDYFHYYYYLKKQSPAKRLVPQVNATWVESNAAHTKPTPQPPQQDQTKTSSSNFWDIDFNNDYDDGHYNPAWQPWMTVRNNKTRKVYHPFGRQGYRLQGHRNTFHIIKPL